MKSKRWKRRNRHKASKVSLQAICSYWNKYSYPYFRMTPTNNGDVVFKYIYKGKNEKQKMEEKE